jgi:RHS repeat-associated protein
VERKVTRGIDPPEVEGYQWDGWKLIMIAKLNTDGTYHSRKWSCVWRPDIGSSLYARNDWMRAGGVGGVAWLQTGAVPNYSYGTGSAEVHVPLADHMGNVRHYYQFKASGKTVTGQLVASYEYDAFGREMRAWGTNTPATNQPPGLPANRPWADLLPFHYSSKLRDADSGFNYYGYRFYDPGAGRWLNRDPIGEAGGLNLYRFCYNDCINWFDYLGWTPVNGGISIPNGTGPTANGQIEHFDQVADDGADKGRKKRADSGKEMLDFLQELSKNSCCIKKLTVAGHGWDSVQRDGVTPAVDGPGLPGVADGSGLYEDGPSGDRWATDPNARRLSDLEKDIVGGKTTFCKPCEVRIHACNISPSFAEKLGSITKCKVIYARGACSGRRLWKSGVGKEPGGNTPDNGFWQSHGGLPSTATGNSFRP